jgi:cytochrome c553
MIRIWLLAAAFVWPALVSAQAAAPATAVPAATAPAANAPTTAAPATAAPATPAPATPAPAAAAPAAPAPVTAAPPPSDGAKIAAGVCSACHGVDGHSVAPANPNLAGLPAAYITLQLMHFKAGIRQNAIMQGFAATLSDADMVALGEYFSKQVPKANSATDPAMVRAGQAIFRGGIASAGVPACAACHSPDGAGIPTNFPRLAGQWADYTYAQLKAFSSGARGNDSTDKDINGHIMYTIAGKLTDANMHALAQFAQGLH